jgi:hypothetical protein
MGTWTHGRCLRTGSARPSRGSPLREWLPCLAIANPRTILQLLTRPAWRRAQWQVALSVHSSRDAALARVSASRAEPALHPRSRSAASSSSTTLVSSSTFRGLLR